MARTREIPLNPLHDDQLDSGVMSDERVGNPEFDDDARKRVVQVAGTPRPYTSVEALMRCAPGDEPEPSVEELYPLRDILQDAIEDALTDRERYVFDAIATERASVREVGARLNLGKSQVHRIYQQACATLAAYLNENPTINNHLKENK